MAGVAQTTLAYAHPQDLMVENEGIAVVFSSTIVLPHI